MSKLEKLTNFLGVPVVAHLKSPVPHDKQENDKFYYHIRHTDNGNTAATIETRVYVNYHSTLVTSEPIKGLEKPGDFIDIPKALRKEFGQPKRTIGGQL